MTATLEAGVQESLQDLQRQAGAGDALAQTQHVGIVVLARHAGLELGPRD